MALHLTARISRAAPARCDALWYDEFASLTDGTPCLLPGFLRSLHEVCGHQRDPQGPQSLQPQALGSDCIFEK